MEIKFREMPMRPVSLFFAFVLVMIQLTGCNQDSASTSSSSSDSASSDTSVPVVNDRRLKLGVEYVVTDNDRLVNIGDSPIQIQIRHVSNTEERYLTLLKGSAELH